MPHGSGPVAELAPVRRPHGPMAHAVGGDVRKDAALEIVGGLLIHGGLQRLGAFTLVVGIGFAALNRDTSVAERRGRLLVLAVPARTTSRARRRWPRRGRPTASATSS